MSMIKRIKNNSGGDKFVVTRTISNGDYYDLDVKYWPQVLDDDDFVADVVTDSLLYDQIIIKILKKTKKIDKPKVALKPNNS